MYVLGVSHEWQVVYNYFSEYSWLGIIFVYHVLLLRYIKVNMDCINIMFKWHGLGMRVNISVAKNVFDR